MSRLPEPLFFTREAGRARNRGAWPRCPWCASRDSMPAFRKPERIALVSMLIRRLRRRFCRACGRHFWSLRRPESRRTS